MARNLLALRAMADRIIELYRQAPELALLEKPGVVRGSPFHTNDIGLDDDWHWHRYGPKGNRPYIAIGRDSFITYNPMKDTWRCHLPGSDGSRDLSDAKTIELVSNWLAQWIVESYPQILASQQAAEAQRDRAREEAERERTQKISAFLRTAGVLALIIVALKQCLF